VGGVGKHTHVIKPMRIAGKKNMYLGNNVTILNGGRLETVAQWGDKKYAPKLIIHDGVSIEQRCHIIAVDTLEIGENTVMSADVYISDCSHRYDEDKRIMDSELVVKRTTIGANVFIGIGAKIMPGVTIGDRAVIGANAVVTKDVPPNQVWAGVPARYIRDNIIKK